VVSGLAIAAAVIVLTPRGDDSRPPKGAPVPERVVATAHYTMSSWATASQTRDVGEAVEALARAYSSIFAAAAMPTSSPEKLKLWLYRDQAQFKANNRSSPWAEAYYRHPICHAYYAAGESNPYHWMLHEAVHQLNEQVAHIQRPPWIDEGLATYFGASELRDGVLTPGRTDPAAYPIWWLSSLALSGDLQADIETGRIIPLRTLIASKRADIGENVNLYYVEYWSFSHFLMHADGGRYKAGYKQVIAAGGSLQAVEALIGPVERLQEEWYAYLEARTEILNPTGDIVVVEGGSSVDSPAKIAP
jgi:hypothetical protein